MYKRILLKLSGEALSGTNSDNLQVIDYRKVQSYVDQIIKIRSDFQLEIGIVIGAGNITRGRTADEYGIDRVQADYMGMLATNINALALQSILDKQGVESRIMSSIKVEQACEFYIRRRALRHFEKQRIVIFSGGTSNPYFSTDTAASLRAKEMNADILIKATKVDGVYSADPEKDKDAKLIKKLTYKDVIEKKYKVMDNTAYELCREQKMPMAVLNINAEKALYDFLDGKEVGTLITE